MLMTISDCGKVELGKTDCAPRRVLKQVKSTDISIQWLHPTSIYRPSEFGEKMVDSFVEVLDFTLDADKEDYYNIYVQENAVESEEHLLGLNFKDAVSETWFSLNPSLT